MSTNNKISNLVGTQVPFFVRNDHPNFVAFLEAYYEYLEQSGFSLENGKVVDRSRNLLTYFDVDKTLDEFAEYLYHHFLQSIPRDVVVDKRFLLKHIKDFYMARGTEKATRFLMRILFNKEIDFYYPKDDVLRASDGKWYIEKYINVANTSVNNVSNSNIVNTEKFISTKIQGISSNTTAVVDKVIRVVESGQIVDQLYLSSILGTFISGEKIYAKYTANGNTSFITSEIVDNRISKLIITNRGSLYNVGNPILIESNTGTGANIAVASVSRGELIDAIVTYGGAGFQVGNPLVVVSDTGSGATGSISLVNDNNFYHPNSYNVIYSTIALEANTALSATYSNLNSSDINTTIINAVNTFVVAGLGPISELQIGSSGSNYVQTPAIDVSANNRLRELGILGRMDIVRGGSNYIVGDTIDFVNPIGTYGFGAKANVTNVSGSGAITQVKFVKYNSEMIGGSGYNANNLPTAVITSSGGTGAIIKVTAVLGDNERIDALSDVFGAIKEVVINSAGNNYSVPATANLTQYGDGKATGYAVLAKGYNELSGRYLNDDGFISAYNFLQDKDFYQNYSYVIVIKESIEEYRDAIKNLLHPAGMKLFGDYDYIAADVSQLPILSVSTTDISVNTISIGLGTFNYSTNTDNIMGITLTSHGFVANDNVYIEFIDTSGRDSNTFFVLNADTNVFNVSVLPISTSYSGNAMIYKNVL